MLLQRGSVSRDSDDDSAFIALNISITTRIERDIVDADLAILLENMSQPISGNAVEQVWKCD